MNILAVSDIKSPYYWDFFERSKMKDIDLILSCGDLDPEYLSLLATFSKGPVLYVHGNHDSKYKMHPPEGCICIENQIYIHEGLRILGLGGSMRYHSGEHQYTEKEMRNRVRRMKLKIMWNRGFDILLTHAPALNLGDGDDLPHQGFQIFRSLLDTYQPQYFVHGHMHLNYEAESKRTFNYGRTKIINAYEKYLFEYETGHFL